MKDKFSVIKWPPDPLPDRGIILCPKKDGMKIHISDDMTMVDALKEILYAAAVLVDHLDDGPGMDIFT